MHRSIPYAGIISLRKGERKQLEYVCGLRFNSKVKRRGLKFVAEWEGDVELAHRVSAQALHDRMKPTFL